MSAVSCYPPSPIFQRKQARPQPNAPLIHSKSEHPLQRMKNELKQRTVSRSLVEDIITNVLSNHTNKLHEKTSRHDMRYIKASPPRRQIPKPKEAPLKSTSYIKRAQQVMPSNILTELKDEITRKPSVHQKHPSQKMEVRVKVTTTRCTRKQVTTNRRVADLKDRPSVSKQNGAIVTPDLHEKKKIIEKLMKARQKSLQQKQGNQNVETQPVNTDKAMSAPNGTSKIRKTGSNESLPAKRSNSCVESLKHVNVGTPVQKRESMRVRKEGREKCQLYRTASGRQVHHVANSKNVTSKQRTEKHVSSGSRDKANDVTNESSSVVFKSHGTFVNQVHHVTTRSEKKKEFRKVDKHSDRDDVFEVVKVELVNSDGVRPIKQTSSSEGNTKERDEEKQRKQQEKCEHSSFRETGKEVRSRRPSVAEKTCRLFQSIKEERRSKHTLRQYFADLQEIKTRLQLQQFKRNVRPRDFDDQTKLKGIVSRLKPMFEELPLPAPSNMFYNRHTNGMFTYNSFNTYNITTRSEKMESRTNPFKRQDRALVKTNTKIQQDEKSHSNEKLNVCSTVSKKDDLNLLKMSQAESKLTYTLENVKKYVSEINPSLATTRSPDVTPRLNKETIAEMRPMQSVYDLINNSMTRNCKTHM